MHWFNLTESKSDENEHLETITFDHEILQYITERANLLVPFIKESLNYICQLMFTVLISCRAKIHTRNNEVGHVLFKK